MFTGLIEEMGTITQIEESGDGRRYRILGPKVTSDAKHGDSISVSGVCLTAVELAGDGSFVADVMRQSLNLSNLGELAIGSNVNLERAALVGSRLGGHIVQGHVDGVAEVLEVRPGEQWRVIRFSLPQELAPLLVDKGSITVDGVSLTISNIGVEQDHKTAQDQHWFEVSLIPETLTATTLGALSVGDRVNIETDIVARHVQRLMSFTLEK